MWSAMIWPSGSQAMDCQSLVSSEGRRVRRPVTVSSILPRNAHALAQEGCATAVLSRVSTAGQITSYAAPSREIQLGLKLRMFPTV